MFRKLKEWLSGSPGAPAKTPEQGLPPLASPFELVTSTGAKALETWRELRGKPGIMPVLLGTRESAAAAFQVMSFNEETPGEILSRGMALDVDGWMKERMGEQPEFFGQGDSEPEKTAPIPAMSPARDILTGKPHDKVYFALVPAAHPWQVPAYLKPGNWNECPDPSLHLALFKRWHDRYGAIVTTVTNDIIEFEVARPPRTLAEARPLAMEQFMYCTDIVEQGVGTPSNLAGALVNSSYWYFWWD